MSGVAPTVDLPTFVEKYIKLRDGREKVRDRQKQEIAVIDAAMEKCEAVLLKLMSEQKMESVRVSTGTIYRTTRTSCTVADWDTALGWIQQNGAFHMLERRVSKQAAEQFKNEHGTLPPGLNWREEVVVQIRRS